MNNKNIIFGIILIIFALGCGVPQSEYDKLKAEHESLKTELDSLTASVFIFMGSQNKNLGDIEVNSITVRTPGGKKVVWLGPAKSGNGVLETYNAHGKETAYLGGTTGHLVTYDEYEKISGYFGTQSNNNKGILRFVDGYRLSKPLLKETMDGKHIFGKK